MRQPRKRSISCEKKVCRRCLYDKCAAPFPENGVIPIAESETDGDSGGRPGRIAMGQRAEI